MKVGSGLLYGGKTPPRAGSMSGQIVEDDKHPGRRRKKNKKNRVNSGECIITAAHLSQSLLGNRM